MRKLKTWQEFLYAFSAFGPNLLNIFVTAYLLDAIVPIGFSDPVQRGLWSFTGAVVVDRVLFTVLISIAKAIDGVIDVPMAFVFQKINGRRIGRHRFGMLIGLVPASIFYLLMWNPFSLAEGSGLNTVLIPVLAFLYFTSYTLMMLSYYSTFTEIVSGERQRVRLSSWKAVWDVVGYSVAYALIPVFIGFGMNIRTIVMMFAPLLLTMIIPQCFVREEAEGAPQTDAQGPSLLASLKLTLTNRDFRRFAWVMGAMMFGLQMFLAAQNVIASGVMHLDGFEIAMMNIFAFAPVPVMAIIFNIIQKRKGTWFGYRVGLILFAVAMALYGLPAFVGGPMLPLWGGMAVPLFGAVGGTIGSFSIAAFFATQYILPSQIAAAEMERTGRNNGSMYFAVQGLVVAGVSALSAYLVYPNLKAITFLGREEYGIALVAPFVAAMSIVGFLFTYVFKGGEAVLSEKEAEGEAV
ncbi:MAG: MFS transporter [Clostridiales Family XIII bacterium]|jgi:GPH family glycoside/pentoside/hexuronide:cation symporter|nr:MFS transporter [Clostridiales Family XIII bacterium]